MSWDMEELTARMQGIHLGGESDPALTTYRGYVSLDSTLTWVLVAKVLSILLTLQEINRQEASSNNVGKFQVYSPSLPQLAIASIPDKKIISWHSFWKGTE